MKSWNGSRRNLIRNLRIANKGNLSFMKPSERWSKKEMSSRRKTSGSWISSANTKMHRDKSLRLFKSLKEYDCDWAINSFKIIVIRLKIIYLWMIDGWRIQGWQQGKFIDETNAMLLNSTPVLNITIFSPSSSIESSLDEEPLCLFN